MKDSFFSNQLNYNTKNNYLNLQVKVEQQGPEMPPFLYRKQPKKTIDSFLSKERASQFLSIIADQEEKADLISLRNSRPCNWPTGSRHERNFVENPVGCLRLEKILLWHVRSEIPRPATAKPN